MADFTSKVSYVSKDIDAKDRIKLKDTTNALKIDEMVNEERFAFPLTIMLSLASTMRELNLRIMSKF